MPRKSYSARGNNNWRLEAARELLDKIDTDRRNPTAFKEKYGETIEASLEAAQAGKIGKITQLIGWDKGYLGDPLILGHIISADEIRDKNFLNEIAKAIRRHDKPKLRKHGRLLESFRKAVDSGKCKNEEDLMNYASILEEELNKIEWADDDPTFDLVRDTIELPKWIKRNKTLIFNDISGE